MQSLEVVSETKINSPTNHLETSGEDFTKTLLTSGPTYKEGNQENQQNKHQSRSTRSVWLSGPTHLTEHQSFQKGTGGYHLNMGNSQAQESQSSNARQIISEIPHENPEDKNALQDSESTGNCRLWSDNVYYKLFFDPQGREAKLMVLKCEITYVDIFTDREHCLYRGRFIGAKTDGVANLFVFDLMKSHWEIKLPKSQAIELNVDIVMSSAPIHDCAESLFNLLRLEKSYLKHLHFDGQLNIMMRFAHPHAWDVKDDATRERVHNGLRNLFLEGVNLEVMSADTIVEEMKVDGIATESNEKIKHFTNKRQAWKAPTMSQTNKFQNFNYDETKLVDGDVTTNVGLLRRAESPNQVTSSAHSEIDSLHSDAYQAYLHTGLWNIIQK